MGQVRCTLTDKDQTSSGLDGGCDFTDKENKLDDVEKNMDLETRRIYGMYEDGQSVSFIAVEIGKSETYVYTKMRRVPEKYEDVKRMRQESKNSRLRRISSLADMNNERYMEDMWDDSEMAAENIDKINRIGKEYAHRLQLIEGKATENYGVGGKGTLPFQVIITKTYEKEESQVIIDSDKTEDDADVK